MRTAVPLTTYEQAMEIINELNGQASMRSY